MAYIVVAMLLVLWHAKSLLLMRGPVRGFRDFREDALQIWWLAALGHGSL